LFKKKEKSSSRGGKALPHTRGRSIKEASWGGQKTGMVGGGSRKKKNKVLGGKTSRAGPQVANAREGGGEFQFVEKGKEKKNPWWVGCVWFFVGMSGGGWVLRGWWWGGDIGGYRGQTLRPERAAGTVPQTGSGGRRQGIRPENRRGKKSPRRLLLELRKNEPVGLGLGVKSEKGKELPVKAAENE